MLFWIIIAVLTGAAIMAVLAPLGRAAEADRPAERARRVYLDQLTELERDRADGRISADEADAARAEIARRLIATDREAGGMLGPGSAAARRAVAVGALIGIPLLSLGLYLGLGAPNLPGQPLAARLAAPSAPDDIEMLIAKVEEHLARAPEDGRGWEVVAPVYLKLGRADDAAAAYRNAIRLLGSTAERQTGLGEAIFAAQGGIVTADARAAFEAANVADPTAPAPLFYLALAAEQEGDRQAAADRWRALLAQTPADAPWRSAVEESLARVGGEEVASGPSGAEIAAAESMTPDEQAEMVEGMVSGLAERLEREPDDAEGWMRLIRSYVVLGRAEDAAEAARAALAGVTASGDKTRIEALIADLGLSVEADVQ